MWCGQYLYTDAAKYPGAITTASKHESTQSDKNFPSRIAKYCPIIKLTTN